MSGGPEKTSSTTLQPWYMSRPLGQYANQLRDFEDPGFFPGQTYAGQSDLTAQGIGGLGSVDYSGTRDYFNRALGGEFTQLNPQFANAVMEPAMENVASRFEQAGRYGSPASQQQMAESGMRALAPYYDAERSRQQQAALALPGLDEQQAMQQLRAGGMEELWDQKGISEAMARHDYPYAELQRFGQLLSPLSLGSGAGYTQQTVPGGSQLAGGLGGALSGAMAGAAHPLLGAGAGTMLGPLGWAGMIGGGLLGAFG